MNNVSHQFNEQYVPVKALLIYNSVVQETNNYERKETEFMWKAMILESIRQSDKCASIIC
jgi:hypothetical protein